MDNVVSTISLNCLRFGFTCWRDWLSTMSYSHSQSSHARGLLLLLLNSSASLPFTASR